MRKFCVALGLAITVLMAGAAMAQQEGAIVERYQGDWDIAWVEWDGANTWVILSTYPDFSCDSAQSVPDRWQVVTTPTAAIHYHEHSRFFARVYDWDITLEEFQGDPFHFICDEENPPTAEGILSATWYDNDGTGVAAGGNAWGHVMNGSLKDLTGTCKRRVVNVDIMHMWRLLPGWDDEFPACWDYVPSCVEVRVWRGPTVRCAN